jgi:short subunit dehydrogenase-like uncharacterized protein
LSRLTAPFLAMAAVQEWMKARIERTVRGPDEAARAKSSVQLWGRVQAGSSAVSLTMTVPDGYSLTADAALECALRVRKGGVAPGAWTPSLAFGSAFVSELPGVQIHEPRAES